MKWPTKKTLGTSATVDVVAVCHGDKLPSSRGYYVCVCVCVCVCVWLTGDSVVPRKGKGHGLKIFQRFHFSSALKRMSVIAGYTPPGSTDVDYIVTVKGAPEVLKNMVSYWVLLVSREIQH